MFQCRAILPHVGWVRLHPLAVHGGNASRNLGNVIEMTTERSIQALEAPAILAAAAGKKDEEHTIGAFNIYENGDFDRLKLSEDATATTEVAAQFVLNAAQHIIDGTVPQVRDNTTDPVTPDTHWVHNESGGLATRRKHFKVGKNGLTLAQAIKGLETPIGNKGNTVMAEYLRRNMKSARFVKPKTVKASAKAAAAPDMDAVIDQMAAQMQAQIMAQVMAKIMSGFGGNNES